MTRAPRRLVIGTRGSPLALAQTEIVVRTIGARWPELASEVRPIRTEGDVRRDVPLATIAGRGVFVGAIEDALRKGEVDVAVHSAKDLPSDSAPDLTIAAYLEREDPRDVLVSRDRATLRELPPNARIGTGSVRRACQLRARRPDVQVLDIRGNVDTRLRKLDAGEFDAIVLAGAGLARLGLADRVTEWLATDVMLPAVGQGALAVQVRRADDEAVAWIQAVADAATTAALEAERSFLARLGAGCAAAVGALAMTGPDETLSLEGMIGAPAGTSVRGSVSGPTSRAAELGTILGNILLGGGGERFLAEGRGAEP